MAKAKNILFIMCDQLRADYLSCAGHDRLETPNIDKLAERGVLFPNTFCQAPICGGSRMNFYTGRYAFSNGATWNGVPLNVNERTIGDYLKPNLTNATTDCGVTTPFRHQTLLITGI